MYAVLNLSRTRVSRGGVIFGAALREGQFIKVAEIFEHCVYEDFYIMKGGGRGGNRSRAPKYRGPQRSTRILIGVVRGGGRREVFVRFVRFCWRATHGRPYSAYRAFRRKPSVIWVAKRADVLEPRSDKHTEKACKNDKQHAVAAAAAAGNKKRGGNFTRN